MIFFLPQPQKSCLEVHPGMCEDYTFLLEVHESSFKISISTRSRTRILDRDSRSRLSLNTLTCTSILPLHVPYSCHTLAITRASPLPPTYLDLASTPAPSLPLHVPYPCPHTRTTLLPPHSTCPCPLTCLALAPTRALT